MQYLLLGLWENSSTLVSGTLEKLASLALKVRKDIKDYGDQLSKEYDENRQIHEYLQSIKWKPLFIYEETFLTKLLEKCIAQVKGQDKKVIVVIEDLDCIDPEHIFRILNVFSVHFDSKTIQGENSFGIDTLVAVCDEENIRNIFANRYGNNVDYGGYIDKFYSTSIFHFNYAELAHDYICDRISHIVIGQSPKLRVNSSIEGVVTGDGFLEVAMIHLFDNRKINLRNINKVLNKPIPFAHQQLKFGTVNVKLDDYLIILQLLILAEICGSFFHAIESLQQLTYINNNFPQRGVVFQRLIAVLIAHNGSHNGKVAIKIGEMGYSGTLDVNDSHQVYVTDLVVSGSFGTAGIDSIKIGQLFAVAAKVLELISRSPKLRLYF